MTAALVTSPQTVTRRSFFSSDGSDTARPTRRSLSTIIEDSHASHDCMDLPPITHMKNAIARNKISEGLGYALPVDKSKNAVEGKYRTNLRLVFKEPYVSENKTFNDERLIESSKHHLQPNTVPSLLQQQSRTTHSAEDWRLNLESEKVRLNYSYSAPCGGITSGKGDLRPRSTLFLPLKARVPPEAIRLKEEATRIIQSVQERSHSAEEHPDHIPAKGSARLKRLSRHFSLFPDITIHSESTDWDDDDQNAQKKASQFQNYANLKAFKPAIKRPLPEDLKTSHLSTEKAEMIWDWLWNYERITDFSFFMEVCD